MKVERLPEQPNQKITVTDKDVKTWTNLFGLVSIVIDLWKKIKK